MYVVVLDPFHFKLVTWKPEPESANWVPIIELQYFLPTSGGRSIQPLSYCGLVVKLRC